MVHFRRGKNNRKRKKVVLGISFWDSKFSFRAEKFESHLKKTMARKYSNTFKEEGALVWSRYQAFIPFAFVYSSFAWGPNPWWKSLLARAVLFHCQDKGSIVFFIIFFCLFFCLEMIPYYFKAFVTCLLAVSCYLVYNFQYNVCLLVILSRCLPCRVKAFRGFMLNVVASLLIEFEFCRVTLLLWRLFLLWYRERTINQVDIELCVVLFIVCWW